MKKDRHPPPPPGFDATRLLEVIRIQTEIAKRGLDLAGVMSLVAEQAHRLLNASGAVVELVDGEEMVYRATAGVAESLLGMRLKRSGSLSGRCIEEGRGLHCEDSESDPRVDREACRRVGLRSMIVSPLKFQETPVGVLKVLASQPYAFTLSDFHLLELLAEPIAAAMYFAARHESGELFHRATHDGLTGLANRAFFYDCFQQRLRERRQGEGAIEIVSFDMDGLKAINDHHGHRAGDAAIKEFAARLCAFAGKGDLVARMGGDEFSIITSGCDEAQRRGGWRESFARNGGVPFLFEGISLDLSASVGIASYPEDGLHLDDLLEKADQRMYAEKRLRQGERRLAIGRTKAFWPVSEGDEPPDSYTL